MAVARRTDSRARNSVDRRRRRQELLEQRALSLSWRNRLLARRQKYRQARRDLARHLSALDASLPPKRPVGG
jgi:hypothetical protein